MVVLVVAKLPRQVAPAGWFEAQAGKLVVLVAGFAPPTVQFGELVVLAALPVAGFVEPVAAPVLVPAVAHLANYSVLAQVFFVLLAVVAPQAVIGWFAVSLLPVLTLELLVPALQLEPLVPPEVQQVEAVVSIQQEQDLWKAAGSPKVLVVYCAVDSPALAAVVQPLPLACFVRTLLPAVQLLPVLLVAANLPRQVVLAARFGLLVELYELVFLPAMNLFVVAAQLVYLTQLQHVAVLPPMA